MIRWFGASWNAPMNIDRAHTATPVGEPCAECHNHFVEGDQGVGLPYYGASSDSGVFYYHRGCLAVCLGLTPREEAKEEMPVAHLLENNLPRCLFVHEPPQFWPPGHLWVPVATEATCKKCLAPGAAPIACTAGGPPCCSRKGEFRGFGVGAKHFDCPQNCACHD